MLGMLEQPDLTVALLLQEPAQESENKPGGQRWEPVKLLRAEWAHPRSVPALYSRVLYITNLPHVRCAF